MPTSATAFASIQDCTPDYGPFKADQRLVGLLMTIMGAALPTLIMLIWALLDDFSVAYLSPYREPNSVIPLITALVSGFSVLLCAPSAGLFLHAHRLQKEYPSLLSIGGQTIHAFRPLASVSVALGGPALFVYLLCSKCFETTLLDGIFGGIGLVFSAYCFLQMRVAQHVVIIEQKSAFEALKKSRLIMIIGLKRRGWWCTKSLFVAALVTVMTAVTYEYEPVLIRPLIILGVLLSFLALPSLVWVAAFFLPFQIYASACREVHIERGLQRNERLPLDAST